MKSIDELATVGRGRSKHRPRNDPALYGGSYPFVQTADIHASDLYINSFSKTYSDLGLAQSKLWEPGILCITNAGENTGDCAILDIEACFPDSIIAVTPDPEKADVFFLKYSVDRIKHQLRGVTKGATQDNLSVSKLVSFKFPVPPLSTQKRIGEILCSYGDLIENNRRRIQLLEETARLLYKEWFVHLRFPSHEHVTIHDGVPDGWKRAQFSTLLSHYIGGGWGKDEALGSETSPAYVIRGTDIQKVTDGTFNDIGLRFHKEKSLQSRLLSQGDIIFEVSGGSATQPVGRALLMLDKHLQIFNGSVICASFCKLLRSHSRVLSAFLFYFLKHSRESGELLVFQKQSSSALQNFNFAAFLEHQNVLVPPKTLLEEFSDQVFRVHNQIALLGIQNYQLSKARDLLLPRLMNGEIAV